MRCENCGKVNEDDARTCVNCGPDPRAPSEARRAVRLADLALGAALLSPLLGLFLNGPTAWLLSEVYGAVPPRTLTAIAFMLWPVLAVGLGLIAVAVVVRTRGPLGALVMASIAVVISLGASWLMFRVYAGVRSKAQAAACTSHLCELQKATAACAREHDGALLPANRWCDTAVARDPCQCPSGRAPRSCAIVPAFAARDPDACSAGLSAARGVFRPSGSGTGYTAPDVSPKAVVRRPELGRRVP
jgi:hypothetical protein